MFAKMIKFALYFSAISATFIQAATYNIGDYAQGGIVFWVDPSGEHGLTAAIGDQDGGNGIAWYNGLNVATNTIANGVYLGSQNTKTIIEIQGDFENAEAYAAKAASDYSVTVGGVTYTGWYLPSSIEANLMFQTADIINDKGKDQGGHPFVRAKYWTSNEIELRFAQDQDFNSGSQGPDDKSQLLRVRAIRAF